MPRGVDTISTYRVLQRLLLAPVLSYSYFRLAVKEESDLLRQFGEAYKAYAASVSRFLPRRPFRALS